jgi:membrane protein implicated in regulation of membrane protease activity
MIEEEKIVPAKENTVSAGEKPEVHSIKPWVIIVVAVLILAIITTAVYFLMNASPETTSKIRDIFIIFMALEFGILGVALVVLLVQLAKLVNMLENEVKPIIASTQETLNTLKGTTEFLSENLVTPVIKLNSYMAGFKKVFDLLKIIRR